LEAGEESYSVSHAIFGNVHGYAQSSYSGILF
jgi:hypothetical protein